MPIVDWHATHSVLLRSQSWPDPPLPPARRLRVCLNADCLQAAAGDIQPAHPTHSRVSIGRGKTGVLPDREFQHLRMDGTAFNLLRTYSTRAFPVEVALHSTLAHDGHRRDEALLGYIFLGVSASRGLNFVVHVPLQPWCYSHLALSLSLNASFTAPTTGGGMPRILWMSKPPRWP